MPQYQILRMDKEGTPPLFYDGKPLILNEPAEAAQMCKIYAQRLGEKLCVKPVADEAWRQRETKRMLKQDYRPLPWTRTGWWADAYAIWKDQYPHASLEKPGYIAYTKSEEDGIKDKQSLLRPGAYLSKYFERHMNNYGLTQKRLVDEFMVLYGPIEVKFATTEDEIIKTFDNGLTCMSNDKEWPNDIHPCSIYAAGDLAIAYLGNLDGNVSARTLVWQEKKIHSRVYGDIARLTQGLNRLGYVWGAPIGAKLKRIQLDKRTEYINGRIPMGCFLAPYIDKKNQQGGGHLGVIDKGTHLEICMSDTPGSHHCGLADGKTGNYVPRLDEHPRYTCDNCDEETMEVIQIHPNEHDDDTQSWCKRCRRDAWRCGYSGNYYGPNVDWKEVGGDYWLPYYAEMYAVRCEGTGHLYRNEGIVQLTIADGTTKTFSRDYVRIHFGGIFRSQMTNRLYCNDEKCRIYDKDGDSYLAAKQELKHHAFQCDVCDLYWRTHLRHQVKDTDTLICPNCYDNPKINKKIVLSPRAEGDRADRAQLPLIAAE